MKATPTPENTDIETTHCVTSFNVHGIVDSVESSHSLLSTTLDTELAECLLNFPEVAPDRPFPLDCAAVAAAQADHTALQQHTQHKPKQCQ